MTISLMANVTLASTRSASRPLRQIGGGGVRPLLARKRRKKSPRFRQELGLPSDTIQRVLKNPYCIAPTNPYLHPQRHRNFDCWNNQSESAGVLLSSCHFETRSR